VFVVPMEDIIINGRFYRVLTKTGIESFVPLYENGFDTNSVA
jgi:hypothetical protein